MECHSFQMKEPRVGMLTTPAPPKKNTIQYAKSIMTLQVIIVLILHRAVQREYHYKRNYTNIRIRLLLIFRGTDIVELGFNAGFKSVFGISLIIQGQVEEECLMD